MSVDVHDPVAELCNRLGYAPGYVFRLDLEPTRVTIYAYRGKDGFCKGPKFVEDGEPVYEPPVALDVTT